jgi:hypothetical protein
MAAGSPMLMGSKREKEDPCKRPRRSIGRPVDMLNRARQSLSFLQNRDVAAIRPKPNRPRKQEHNCNGRAGIGGGIEVGEDP